ncbi:MULTISPECIES: malate synthase G [Virgibacillus]|uniref:Malate synthase G n=1 Tax=Virgibacillus dokdonensis TaxID=302167 RepID=A0A2K9J061_9BACI|nr:MULTISPECIES: malate synthase G [Virgibacillus]AUJ25347.1 Malate synthase G [Virgibacillus dokdonensis]NWO13814.1 malate synthase G [Virgibacillus sp.]
MTAYITKGNLQIATELYEFVNKEALPGTGLNQEKFWQDFDELVTDLAPKNKALLVEREKMQQRINDWLQTNDFEDQEAYTSFLKEIGYLEPEVDDFTITTENVDDTITKQAGPQLVVPIDNERYALNAANARWGSLYDALYGSDVISEEDGAEKGASYNPIRGQWVIEFGKKFLNDHFPLQTGSHAEVTRYFVSDGNLHISLENGATTALKHTAQFVGYQGDVALPTAILFVHNGLHVEVQIDPSHPIGKTDVAGVKDIVLEAATTTIMDCEDSVAAVDAEDKTLVYRNWLGLNKGNLSATFTKDEKEITRTLHADRTYKGPNGEAITLSGRVLMFVRNVGHLMTTNVILTKNGEEIPEGIMDGVFTSLMAKHDLLGSGRYRNSQEGSIYIVKPKMHGSKEVAFANELFHRIEDMLDLERYTIKIGVMDEERRTSLNLKNCIYQVKERVVFINTGFLDRTGDEIHTSMEAGPMIRKGEMKTSAWLQAYEKNNVQTGLQAGLQGKAQIGKGMWAMPDLMADMLKQKISHLTAGGNTAWVPSPTAATLHALHYHEVDVKAVQDQLAKEKQSYQTDMLQVPIAKQPNWSHEEIQNELDNSCQTLLGYVVRWVDQGVGCSKVPDIHHIGLMEDRATLRISSQMLANWLYHGVCTEEQMMDSLKRMAKMVDKQNEGDKNYRSMAQNFDRSIAFQAACDLIFKGKEQPNGYTEPILHRRRLEVKQNELLSKQ